MHADPDSLARKVLGMGSKESSAEGDDSSPALRPTDPAPDDDLEGEAIEAAASEAAEAMGLPSSAPLVAFARAILTLARES
jgi:hypothetical protein